MFIFKFLLIISIFALYNAENPFSSQPVLISTQLDREYNYRLPNNTRPIHYDVHLTTNIHKGNFDFEGIVTIRLEATQETNNITIHYRKLKILDIKLTNVTNNEKVELLEVTYDNVTEHLVIPVKKPLKNNEQYKLTIEYSGELRTDLAGFHRSSYKNAEGKQIFQAGTHFEPHNARHGFPCYDEPALRATFDISITHGKTYHAVSNMPVNNITPNKDDMVTTAFNTTKSIQTYLIAFVVSDFAGITFEKIDGIKYQLYAKPQSIENGEGNFGLIAGEKILTNQEKYFQTKYSLPKMSQIAMPDFGAGAMENWGIVIYAEYLLLFDESSGTVEAKHGVGHIIGHEFAHQWFGDLVAPIWWSYLWLNEGFATLYASHTMSLVYPQYRDMDLFIVDNLHKAMRVDATGSSRPMTFYVENPQGISSLFDDISYSKAGSVLRMFQHALTDKTWRNGLKYYLEEMQYSAADSDDLARNLQKAANEDDRLPSKTTMKSIMDSWSHNGGFPLLTVNRTKDNSLILSQTKYVHSPKNRANNIWIIPINFASASHSMFNDTTPVVWMDKDKLTFDNKTFHKFGEKDWIIFNLQETGYYRVNYDDNLWNLISDKLSNKTFEDIHVINRAQLVDDVLTLSRNDLVSYDVCFKLLQYLEQEKDFLPWEAANNGFSLLNLLMTGSNHYGKFQTFIAKIVGPLFKTLGSMDLGPKESLSDKRARAIALKWACLSGEEACIKDTKERVNKVLYSSTPDPSVSSTIYCNGMRQATKEMVAQAQKRFNTTKDATERKSLITGMGCIADPVIQKQNLNFTLKETPNGFKQSERTLMLQTIYNSGGLSGIEISIDFMRENYKNIEKYYGTNTVKDNIYKMMDKVTSQTVVDKFEKLIDEMIKAKLLLKADKEVLMELPNMNVKWLEKNENEIEIYLKDYLKGGAESSIMFSTTLMLIGVLWNVLVN